MTDEIRRAVEVVAEVFGGRRGAGLNPIALEGARSAIESLRLTPVGWYCYESRQFSECTHTDGRCGPVYRMLLRSAPPARPEPPPQAPGEPPADSPPEPGTAAAEP